MNVGIYSQRNILVSADGDALLCDFGLSRIRHEISRTHTTFRQGGRLRFTAPELLFGHDALRINESSDIYSLAMTIYTIGTGDVPLYEYPNEYGAARVIEDGKRPSKPSALGGLSPETSTKVWKYMTEMWKHNPADRPSILSVYKDFNILLVQMSPAPSPSTEPIELTLENMDIKEFDVKNEKPDDR